MSIPGSQRLSRGHRRWCLVRFSPRQEASPLRLVLASSDGQRVMRITAPARLLRLPPGPVEISVTAGNGTAVDFQVREVGALAAAWLLVRERGAVSLGSGMALRSLGTALALVARGDWREFVRRLTRSAEAVPVVLPSVPVDRVGTVHRQGGGPVRLAMVAHSLARDGAPLSQFELACGLAESGRYQPHIIAFADGPLRQAYRSVGVGVSLVSLPRLLTEADYQAALAQMAACFAEARSEAVLANTLQTFPAIEAAFRSGLPSVWNPRESEPWETYFDFLPPGVRESAYLCFHRANAVVFVAEATRRAWQPCLPPCLPMGGGGTSLTIHNALRRPPEIASSRKEARASLGLAANEVSVLCLGTLCERKGQEDLLRALGLLSDVAAGHIRIDLVGRPTRPYLDRLAEHLQALPPLRRKRVRLLAETDTPARHYHAADVFVCPSRIESYPRVVLEAMAWGLAIVSTPVFGIAEQIEDGRTGMFYPPGDAATLAHHLEILIADKTKRAELGVAAAIDFARISDYPAMITAYSQVVDALFHDEPASPRGDGGEPLALRPRAIG